MEAANVPFASLRVGRSLQTVAGRLLRFWEARNVKKGGQLMSIDILLIDAKETTMQGSIPVQSLPTFQQLLRDGSVYAISGFEVARSNNCSKLTDFHLSIRFTPTTFIPLDQPFPQIPKELFRFHSYDQIVALANTNMDLPDILGKVCMTRAYHDEATNTLERIVVELRLERENTNEGKRYMDMLNWKVSKRRADHCWRNNKISLRQIQIIKWPIYRETLRNNKPPRNCHRNDMDNHCNKCFYYKQMMKFFNHP